MRLWGLAPALLLALAPTVAPAGEDVGKGPKPDWVQELELEGFTKDRSQEVRFGVAYLLSDRQIRKAESGYEFSTRVAYEIVDRTGLEDAAQITTTFDPSDETVNFNYVRVHRDGEILERLADAEITILRQEDGLESSLLDGNLTALIQLEDVRVGDIIEFGLSGHVESKLWPDELFDFIQTEYYVPLAQLHFSAWVPDGYKLYTRSVGTDVEPEVSNVNGGQLYSIHIRDGDPTLYEENVPVDWVTFGYVTFSSMETWSDVVDWALPLYSIDDPLPGDFAAKLDEIAQLNESKADQAVAALKLVQDDVRYLGIEIGMGSHVPRPPALTLERGYGDCKDKSVLLVSALDYLGIEATPALASFSYGHILPEQAPSISGFDHVIVEFEAEDEKFWVDPTLSHQGGVAQTLAPIDYGYILPIRANQTELVELPAPVSDAPNYEVRETFEVGEDGEFGLRIAVEYIYRRGSADSMRLHTASYGMSNLGRDFLDYYAANYEGAVETQAFEIIDDSHQNILRLTAEYTIDPETFNNSDMFNSLPVHAAAVQDEIPRQVEANRVAPLLVPHGSHTRHLVKVISPDRDFGLPENTVRNTNGIQYSRRFRNDGPIFEIDYTLLVTSEEVAVPEIPAVIKLGDDIADETEIVVYLRSNGNEEDHSLPLSETPSVAFVDAIAEVDEMINEEEYVDALVRISTMLDQYSEPTESRGFLLYKRATVLAELERNRSAVTAFRQSFELYTGESDAFFRCISILRRLGRNDEITPVLAQLFEHHPESINGLNIDWFSRLSRSFHSDDKPEEARKLGLVLTRALSEAKVDDVGDFNWFIVSAVEELVETGDAEEAKEYLPMIKYPDAFAWLMTYKKTEAIWDDVAAVASDDLSDSISSYVTYTQLQANLEPEDYENLTSHVTALRIAGKYEEAARFIDLYISQWARIEAVGEDAFWFVNEAAYALREAGRFDDAMAAMSRLMALGIEDNGSLISMAINRAGMLMHSSDYEAALEAVAELEALDEDFASDYGWMWIYTTKACSLHQLGREDEAAAVFEESMLPIADSNAAAHTKTMLCMNRLDDAAELVVERLAEPDDNSNLIISFSDTLQKDRSPPFLVELRRRSNEVKTRPEVREAFDKVGRPISINGSRVYWGEF